MPTPHDNDTPAWVRTFLRDASIRRGLILYGNVRDEFYDPQERQQVTLSELLARLLSRDRSLGFTMIAQWDRNDGLRFANPREAQRFLDVVARGATANPPGNGAGYDVGPASPPTTTTASGLYKDPRELMGALRLVAASGRERFSLMLDWTHLLLDQPGPVGEEHRQWILDLEKVLVGGPVIATDSDHLRQNRCLVTFLTANLGSLPTVLYQNEPRVRLIAVPAPSRCERRALVLRHIDDLRCQQPDSTRNGGTSATSTREQLAEAISDLTDQQTAVDLRQIISLSLRTENPLPADQLVNLYRFGEQKSPWEELSQEKLGQAEQILKRRVVGQDEAVEKVATVIIRAKVGLAGLHHSRKGCKPKGIAFFVGPPGVGKTELAKAIAEFVFGDESACNRFDMSEYSAEHSDQRLIGAPPGYVGFEDGGQLTNQVRERPFGVRLFDEIEKAHPRILDKFLQILEDGRLTDGRGETTYFSESIIIFTSNIGARDMPATTDHEAMRHHFLTAVERHFKFELGRPELFNRLGRNIIVFSPISDDGFRRAIVEKQIAPLREFLASRYGAQLQTEPAVCDHVLHSARIELGGRDVGNALESELVNPLSRFLFTRQHQLRKGRTINVAVRDNRIQFELQES